VDEKLYNPLVNGWKNMELSSQWMGRHGTLLSMDEKLYNPLANGWKTWNSPLNG